MDTGIAVIIAISAMILVIGALILGDRLVTRGACIQEAYEDGFNASLHDKIPNLEMRTRWAKYSEQGWRDGLRALIEKTQKEAAYKAQRQAALKALKQKDVAGALALIDDETLKEQGFFPDG